MGKHMLVTNGSTEIGQAIAHKLAMQGFKVCLQYHHDKLAAERVQKEIQSQDGHVDLIRFDPHNAIETKEHLELFIEESGPFYGLVFHAESLTNPPIPSMETEDWHQSVHTNLDGFFHVIRPIVMPMIQMKQGGRILLVPAEKEQRQSIDPGPCSAALAGMLATAKSLALDLAKRQITVNSVIPGFMETEGAIDIPLIPLQRRGKVEEVADIVGFLASAHAAYITGQEIAVDGGAGLY